MNIYLPIKPQITGGSSTFARTIKETMRQRGHTVVFEEPRTYDVLLIIASAPFTVIAKARRRGIPIVHRLDGVHSPTTIAGWRYPIYNLPMRLIRNYAAHTVIYQSKFSQKVCEQFFGVLHSTAPRQTMIYNGVDTQHFTPIGPQASIRDNTDQHILFTAQRLRRHDQIKPLLQSVAIYRKYWHQNTKFVIAGDVVPPLSKNILKTFPAWVQYIGPIPHKLLPEYERAADIFLYCHPNPACPNNILEALACGLPIAGVADGAMPEIITHGHNGRLVLPTGDGFYKTRGFSARSFANNINNILGDRKSYSTKARATAVEKFALHTMSTAYAHVFESV